jgi:hypothetical protein
MRGHTSVDDCRHTPRGAGELDVDVQHLLFPLVTETYTDTAGIFAKLGRDCARRRWILRTLSVGGPRTALMGFVDRLGPPIITNPGYGCWRSAGERVMALAEAAGADSLRAAGHSTPAAGRSWTRRRRRSSTHPPKPVGQRWRRHLPAPRPAARWRKLQSREESPTQPGWLRPRSANSSSISFPPSSFVGRRAGRGPKYIDVGCH